ncbi:glycosyltransferase family 9 protein [Inquilinus sp. CA228]|uniref:glycosyltransferase family 9 protein n=1 Tax=Inquilinus sp. CA228 TaxID=3455609 RepID=UPI003F8D2D52
MGLLKPVKRKIRRFLRKRAAMQDFVERTKKVPPADFSIVITGGMGDFIVIARFWRDLLAKVGGGSFDVFSPAPAMTEWIFRAIPGFRLSFSMGLYEHSKLFYTYSFRINQMIYVERKPESIDQIFHKTELSSNTLSIIKNIDKCLHEIRPMAENHPRLDGTLGRYAVFKNRTRRDFLHYMAGIPYGGDRFDLSLAPTVLDRFGLKAGSYITVHNGYDEAMGTVGLRATKAYPGWPEVIAELQRLGLGLQVVQIGTPATSSPIDGAQLNVIGQTSLLEAATLVAGAAFHLDNEGGFVHLANTFGVRSCVVFGPTSKDYFGYPDNINFAPNACGDCWWIEPNWMKECPRGFTNPICMSSHSATEIARSIIASVKPSLTEEATRFYGGRMDELEHQPRSVP